MLYRAFVAQVGDAPWDGRKGQVYPGSDAFVEALAEKGGAEAWGRFPMPSAGPLRLVFPI